MPPTVVALFEATARRRPDEVALHWDGGVLTYRELDQRAGGFARLLSEGGPTVAGELLSTGLLDELFLTVSPALAGRADGSLRRGLVHGREFPANELRRADLVSVRRSDSHLFLRYRLNH